MEETLTNDPVVPITRYNVGGISYVLYCKRKLENEANAIRDDLISSGYDAIVRNTTIDRHDWFAVLWRK